MLNDASFDRFFPFMKRRRFRFELGIFADLQFRPPAYSDVQLYL